VQVESPQFATRETQAKAVVKLGHPSPAPEGAFTTNHTSDMPEQAAEKLFPDLYLDLGL
jgi:hypothetical protein